MSRIDSSPGGPPGVVCYLGLGSNIGNREQHLKDAIESIAALEGVELSRVSSFHETEPVGFQDQPNFINAVLEARTLLSARSLLEALQSIEDEMGRKRIRKWGPRCIDIDILLFGNFRVSEPDLTIPHKDMHLRRFVLAPLCELIPDRKHPVAGLTFGQLLRDAEISGEAIGPRKKRRVSAL
ncbi:MAG: 2-amino-4-hydroxy-6-hydroxymethyldihydropteridine diphosphokinase [Candidatus Coatesbacteria bacterium]|nr:2-amino-4-hydroxy-6-hydroxymethyldihydropteridine diphosphokinase [Candidatus Coatesbacteria bacterium]